MTLAPNGRLVSRYPTHSYNYNHFIDSNTSFTDFQVTDPLPNVSFPITRSFAGNIPVDRPGHPNDTLFFWAYEKANGTLTASESTEPWGIWLNGGPGGSSIAGALFEVCAYTIIMVFYYTRP